jgi:nicotinamidase-related amidase
MQVVVTGVATSGGVEATARQAYVQGFDVTPRTRCNDRGPRGGARVQHQKRLRSSW